MYSNIQIIIHLYYVKCHLSVCLCEHVEATRKHAGNSSFSPPGWSEELNRWSGLVTSTLTCLAILPVLYIYIFILKKYMIKDIY